MFSIILIVSNYTEMQYNYFDIFSQQECTYLFNLNNVQAHIFCPYLLYVVFSNIQNLYYFLYPLTYSFFCIIHFAPECFLDLYHKIILLFNISSTIVKHLEDLNHPLLFNTQLNAILIVSKYQISFDRKKQVKETLSFIIFWP